MTTGSSRFEGIAEEGLDKLSKHFYSHFLKTTEELRAGAKAYDAGMMRLSIFRDEPRGVGPSSSRIKVQCWQIWQDIS